MQRLITITFLIMASLCTQTHAADNQNIFATIKKIGTLTTAAYTIYQGAQCIRQPENTEGKSKDRPTQALGLLLAIFSIALCNEGPLFPVPQVVVAHGENNNHAPSVSLGVPWPTAAITGMVSFVAGIYVSHAIGAGQIDLPHAQR